jgi:hypothetical protein
MTTGHGQADVEQSRRRGEKKSQVGMRARAPPIRSAQAAVHDVATQAVAAVVTDSSW